MRSHTCYHGSTLIYPYRVYLYKLQIRITFNFGQLRKLTMFINFKISWNILIFNFLSKMVIYMSICVHWCFPVNQYIKSLAGYYSHFAPHPQFHCYSNQTTYSFRAAHGSQQLFHSSQQIFSNPQLNQTHSKTGHSGECHSRE